LSEFPKDERWFAGFSRRGDEGESGDDDDDGGEEGEPVDTVRGFGVLLLEPGVPRLLVVLLRLLLLLSLRALKIRGPLRGDAARCCGEGVLRRPPGGDDPAAVGLAERSREPLAALASGGVPGEAGSDLAKKLPLPELRPRRGSVPELRRLRGEAAARAVVVSVGEAEFGDLLVVLVRCVGGDVEVEPFSPPLVRARGEEGRLLVGL